MTAPFTADQVRLLRDLTGLGIMDCKDAMQLSLTPDYGGDVVLAVAGILARGLAVHVHGDRDAWNLSRARTTAPGLRARNPELDTAFPMPVRKK